MAMTGKMVQEKAGDELDQVDPSRAFGCHCLSVTNFNWGGKQHDAICSFKRSSGYCVDMDYTRTRKEAMKCDTD